MILLEGERMSNSITIDEKTTKAQLITAINEDVHFDLEQFVSDICWIGVDEIDNFWEIKDIVNGDELDWEETLNLNGNDLFKRLRFGSVDFTDTFIRFDGYGNLESFNYPQLKEEVISTIQRMDEDVFEEFIREFEGSTY